jgi:uncharacterized circularly permuted ATP-grasp superfamily protein
MLEDNIRCPSGVYMLRTEKFKEHFLSFSKLE